MKPAISDPKPDTPTEGTSRLGAKRMVSCVCAIGLSLASAVPFANDSFAQAIADNMTCAAAVNYYERHGRIYKIAHGKDVIPIYNGVPVSQRDALHCGFGYVRVAYRTRTTDNPRCTISYSCVASGWDR
jgi:hypothetical protein